MSKQIIMSFGTGKTSVQLTAVQVMCCWDTALRLLVGKTQTKHIPKLIRKRWRAEAKAALAVRESWKE